MQLPREVGVIVRENGIAVKCMVSDIVYAFGYIGLTNHTGSPAYCGSLIWDAEMNQWIIFKNGNRIIEGEDWQKLIDIAICKMIQSGSVVVMVGEKSR